MDDIPKLLPSGVVLEPYDALHMKLTHLAQPHQIKLEPPALVVPGEVVCGYTISKTVKIINDSLSSANVKWTCPASDLKFSIRPESFTVGMLSLIVYYFYKIHLSLRVPKTMFCSFLIQNYFQGAGSSRTIEIDIDSVSVGDQEAYINCSFENVEKPLKLFVKVSGSVCCDFSRQTIFLLLLVFVVEMHVTILFLSA